MNVKRALPLVLSLLMAGGAFAGLAGCNKSDGNNPEPPPTSEHQHSYTGWHDNGDGTHSPECTNTTGTCDAPVKTSEKEAHDYGSGTSCTKCGSPKPTTGGEASTPLPAENKIYVVGDSTVCDYSASLDNAFLPRYGYGTQLVEYLNATSDQIVNLAISGRSSKSFLTEANYQKLFDNTNGIKTGDYLIIGFGHNDEKSDDPARYTSANGDHTVSGSFQNVLYENYVKKATDKGATSILCTPIVRYSDTNEYKGDKIHVTAGGDYAGAIKQLGAATNTTVVDLTTITKNIYEADNAAAQYFHCHTTHEGDPVNPITGNEVPSGKDNTHLNKYGAKRVAYEFAKALPADCGLKAHAKTDVSVPTKAEYFKDAIRMDYVKPSYSAPVLGTPMATLQTTTPTVWHASAFGNIGGDSKVGNFTISYASDKFTVSNAGNKNGKFKNEEYDGFGAAFIQIEANKTFTASAKIKVVSKGTGSNVADGQSGFGLMLRDDMYMNKGKDLTVKSNFIAAGLLGNKALFSRNETVLTSESNSMVVADSKEYTVSMVSTGQGVTITISDGTSTYNKAYQDVKMNVIDNQYMYLCLFANRALTVEFSEVQFEITGESQGA